MSIFVVPQNHNSNNTTTAMISVVDHYLPYDTHNLYDVTFNSETIHTLLTSDPSMVDSWISDILRLYRQHIIVGLDVEWRPNTQRNMDNPVATLQLCVGRRCLIFQIIHAPSIPNSLMSFLRNTNHTFMGVGIHEDVEKLLVDYNLGVTNMVDLRTLAADVYGDPEMRRTGLKTLARRVLETEVEKPERIRRGRWDNMWLTAEQVQYACVDAFLSFEIGRILRPNGVTFSYYTH
ncbi:3'-5' exonuclease-like [Gastrolobium bilobum]|uniref:3'-5' exonuclease-like n=1 Tax=Gastrolobium bilobum TaxID=150636 RepID=UPI002AAF34E2|nr:3'-5' exonuclease-like [Gastrolobium bilobum]